MHLAFVDYMPAQILAGGGLVGVQNDLISKALHGQLAFLTNGRHYIVQIDRRPLSQVNPNTGLHKIQINIRWLIAHPAEAQIGEIVPAHTLRPDPKPGGVARFEATLKPQGWRFEPHPEGWQRMT